MPKSKGAMNKSWVYGENINIDDMEGLLINLGVVSALVLSFVLGTLGTITREDYFYGDFTKAMLEDQGFRSYAYDLLRYQGYNFTTIGPSSNRFHAEIINLEDVFVEFEEDYGCDIYLAGRSDCNHWALKVETAAMILSGTFHPADLYSYYINHPASENTIRLHSSVIINCLGGAVFCLSGALFVSIVFYVTLAVLPAREDALEGKNETLERFSKPAFPIILIGFVFLIVGKCFFFVGLSWLVYLRTPVMADAARYSRVFMYLLLFPVTFSTIAAAGVIYYQVFQLSRRLEGNRNSVRRAGQEEKNVDQDKGGGLDECMNEVMSTKGQVEWKDGGNRRKGCGATVVACGDPIP